MPVFPQTPYPLYGTINQFNNTSTISAINRNTSDTQSIESESNGTFIVDCANFQSNGYNEHDLIEISSLNRYELISINISAFPDGIQVDINAPKYNSNKHFQQYEVNND